MTVGDHMTVYEYDSLGRLYKTIESIDATSSRTSIQILDSLDRVIEKRIEDQDGHTLFKEEYAYDANGKKTQTIVYTHAGIAKTHTAYNARSEPTSITCYGQCHSYHL